jgi:hypothetical protein
MVGTAENHSFDNSGALGLLYPAAKELWQDGYDKGYNDACRELQAHFQRFTGQQHQLPPYLASKFQRRHRRTTLATLLLDKITSEPGQMSTHDIKTWVRQGSSSYADHPHLGQHIDTVLGRLRRVNRIIVKIDDKWRLAFDATSSSDTTAAPASGGASAAAPGDGDASMKPQSQLAAVE